MIDDAMRGGVGGENKDSVNGTLSAECDVTVPSRRNTTNGTQVVVYIRPPLSFPSTSTHVQ